MTKMSEWWMLTGPYFRGFKRLLKSFVLNNDCHDWAYCRETGTTGYDHVHLKLACSSSIDINTLGTYFPAYHCEKSNDNIGYLRKRGSLFVSSRDTTPVRQVRFGRLLPWQENLIAVADQQTNRQVTVLVDAEGCLGKSWLAAYMIENSLAYFVPPTISDTKDMIQYIASGYNWEPYIIIDIPRSWKWNTKIATVIETIKDGFVYDTRYSAKWLHIRGVKVIVFTNETPPTKALSPDRWVIIDGRLYRNTSDGRNSFSPPLGGDPVSNVVPSDSPSSGTANGIACAPPHGGDRRRALLVDELRARVSYVCKEIGKHV